MDKNPSANAGDMSLIPGPGRFQMLQATKAHVPQLLKPLNLETVLCNKRSHRNKKPMQHKEEEPLLSRTRENPRAAVMTQCNPKVNKEV